MQLARKTSAKSIRTPVVHLALWRQDGDPGGRRPLDFEIADGGAFYDNGKADGVIADSGAPACLPLLVVGLASAVPEGVFWF